MKRTSLWNPHATYLPALHKAEIACLRASPACRVSGFTHRLPYGAFGRLTQVTDPLNGITRHTYDTRDNLIAVTDANGNTTQYTTDKNSKGFASSIFQRYGLRHG